MRAPGVRASRSSSRLVSLSSACESRTMSSASERRTPPVPAGLDLVRVVHALHVLRDRMRGAQVEVVTHRKRVRDTRSAPGTTLGGRRSLRARPRCPVVSRRSGDPLGRGSRRSSDASSPGSADGRGREPPSSERTCTPGSSRRCSRARRPRRSPGRASPRSEEAGGSRPRRDGRTSRHRASPPAPPCARAGGARRRHRFSGQSRSRRARNVSAISTVPSVDSLSIR